MAALLPPAFLFRYMFPVRLVAGVTGASDVRGQIIDSDRLPSPLELNGEDSFASVAVIANADGLGVSFSINGKAAPTVCDVANPVETDGMQLWIDTRNTQSIHRAGRFCHHFVFLPQGTGRGKKKPFATQLPIARAKEDAPLVDDGVLDVASKIRKDGYDLDIWLPAETMHGYDLEASPRLGFYYAVRDAELGLQTLTVGDEFPYSHDPSLWSTLEIASA